MSKLTAILWNFPRLELAQVAKGEIIILNLIFTIMSIADLWWGRIQPLFNLSLKKIVNRATCGRVCVAARNPNFWKVRKIKKKTSIKKEPQSLLSLESKFLSKIQSFVKNSNIRQKSTFCQKSTFLSKIQVLVKNPNFCQKSKVLSKIQIFVKNQHFVKNPNFCQKSTFLSKIQFFFQKSKFL